MAHFWQKPVSLALLCTMTAATAGTAIAGEGRFGQTGRVSLGDVGAVAAHTDRFVVDNVPLALTSHLSTVPFVSSRPGSPNQGASSMSTLPYRMVHISAIPYGFSAPAEAHVQAAPGSAAAMVNAIRQLNGRAPTPQTPAVTATIFGKPVSGETTLLPDRDDPTHSTVRASANFVTEAGSRLWLVSISQQLPGGAQLDAAMQSFVRDSLQGLTLESGGLNQPTTRKRELQPLQLKTPLSTARTPDAARIRPMNYTGWYVQDPPGWWSNAPCDYNHYYNNTPASVPNPFRLYATAQVPNPWHGLEACGPNPYKYANADVLNHFYNGAWGVYEWECVELSLRWMWQAYGARPYGANGNQVASNYSSSYGGNLVYIYNGYSAPLPVMGDVLQYQGGTYGHTSVVVSESHNGSGNGGLYVIEQNDGDYAGDYLSESNWHVNCSSYNGECPNAWLHRP
jgi:hypothetical protein